MVSFAHVVPRQPDFQLWRLSCLSMAAISVFFFTCKVGNCRLHVSLRARNLITLVHFHTTTATISQTLSLTIRFDSIRFFLDDSRKRLQYKELKCGHFSIIPLNQLHYNIINVYLNVRLCMYVSAVCTLIFQSRIMCMQSIIMLCFSSP